jgi:hypothetical protein
MTNVRLWLVGLAITLCAGRARADESYAVKIDAPPAKRAQRSVAKIHIAPGAGFHVNKDFPTSVTLSDVPAGVAVDKPKQTARDAIRLEDAGAEFDVAFTASAAGKKTFAGELKFAVCSASSCNPKREKISFTVDVN